MDRLKLLLWGILLATGFGSAVAQSPLSFIIKRVPVKGLAPEAFLSTVVQDNDGFVWIGSISGLYRYDGTRVTRFLRDPSDSNSLSHNYVNTLTKDTKGNMWIGTFGSFLNMYERRTGQIRRIGVNAKNTERMLVMKTRMGSEKETVMAASPQCLYKLNYTGNIIDSVVINQGQTRITDFLEYEPGKFLVAAGRLFILDWRTRKYQPLHIKGPVSDYRCLEKGNDGTIHIGANKGVLSLSPADFSIKSELDSSVKEVQCLKKDKKGRLWIGTSAGLFLKEDNELRKITSPDGAISPAEITDIFIDKSETTWIATANNGLYQVYQPSLFFQRILGMQRYAKNSLIQSVTEEKPGVWLIGTVAGLFRYTFASKEFEQVDFGNKQQAGVYYQLRDRKGGLWVGTNSSGLIYFPSGKKKPVWFTHDPLGENTIPSNSISALEEDETGRVWIGTYNRVTKKSSVCYYDESQNTIHRINAKAGDHNYLNAVSISQIENQGKQLWIGTWDNGLYRYRLTGKTPPQNTFTNYSENAPGSHKISHNIVSCVRPAKNGNIWFGTVSGGLNVLDSKSDSVRWYTIKDGLASNFIYRIEEDDEGMIWFSTDNGISRLDPASGSVNNYNESAGLPATNFAFLTSTKCTDGTIVFGTNDGQVVYFNPNLYKNASNHLSAVIVDIRLFNKSVTPSDESILKKAAPLTDTLVLNHDQSVISFELSNMDFINPETYTYAYKLEGFDKDWLYTTDRNSITYTNLDPGTYTLLAKNADHYGIWNDKPTHVVLIVKPPYWRTWWFAALFVLLIASGIYLLFRYRLAQNLKLFAVRQRLHRDLHDDVGATLSSVKAYSEILQTDGNNQIISGLIKENAAEMIDRLEVISWATNPQYDNFKSLTDAMLRFARPITHANGIAMHFAKQGIDDGALMPGDVRQNILLVFKEAVNNMVKYAKATDCRISLTARPRSLVLEIADNGQGLDGTTKGSGTGLKSMKKRAEDLGGTLVINSGSRQGTTVRLAVPYPFKIPNTWDRKIR